MAKTKEETKEPKKAKRPNSKDGKESKEAKGPKGKDGKVLMKRVKKAIKRSRRKLSEEKFEKELQRTISFLEELQQRINHPPASEPTMAMAGEQNQPIGKKSKDKSGKTKNKGKNESMVEIEATIGAQSAPSITGK